MPRGPGHKWFANPRVWFAVGSAVIVATLLAVKWAGAGPYIGRAVSAVAFLYLWSGLLFDICCLFREWRDLGRRQRTLSAVRDTVSALGLLFLTVVAIRRGGIF